MSGGITTVGDLLAASAKVLKERGWCRGALQNDEGQCCALGAMNVAMHGNAYRTHQQWDLKMKAMQALSNQYHGHRTDGYDVIDINNYKIKDQAEAIEWFEKAAANEGITEGIV